MRARLVGLLRDPNDPAVDAKWLEGRGSFDDWFNDLDFLVADNPTESIGVVLKDEREAGAIAAFQKRLNAIYSDLGDAGYSAYSSDPRWVSVRDAALEAVAVLDRPETTTA